MAEDAAEVGVAGLVLGVEAKAVVMPINLGADDGFDAGLGGGLREFNGAVKVVFVGDGNGRKFVVLGEFDNGFDGEGGVEEGVVAVEVERDVVCDA